MRINSILKIVMICSLPISSLKAVELKSELALATGNTSNVEKLSEGTSGVFYRLNPSLGLEFQPLDALVLNFQANAKIKKYFDKKISNVASDENEEIRGTFIWLASDSFEFGSDIGVVRSESSAPVQISTSQSNAEIQKFLEPNGYFYGAWFHDPFEIELGLNTRYRDYSTLLSDRGNFFENDYRNNGLSFKVNYSFNKRIKFKTQISLDKKKYLYRPADFSDGAASNSTSPNPILKESSKEITFGVEYVINGVKLETIAGYRYQKDRVFGARDSNLLKVVQKMSFNLSDKFDWSPGLNLSEEKFKKFRSNPEVNPFGNTMRKDINLSVKNEFKYKINTKYSISAGYIYSRKYSNYANSSYYDHEISTGLSILF
jgi:hypothetical protein